MGLREDLYKDIDRLYQRRIARTHFLKEKSLEAIREGRLPAGLDDRSKDVIRWILEDREMRLRRKRDLKVLRAEWKVDREERERELAAIFEEAAEDLAETRAIGQRVQARVRAEKARLARPLMAEVARAEEEAEPIPELAAIFEGAAEELAETRAIGQRVQARVRAGKARLARPLMAEVARAGGETDEAEAQTAGSSGEDGSREVGWQMGGGW